MSFVLSSILDPITPTEFFSEFWAKKPLYISGQQNKFSSLYSSDRLWDCLQSFEASRNISEGILKDFSVRASFDRGITQISSLPQDARKLYEAGATICVNKVNAADKLLDEIVEGIRQETHFLGGLDFRAYLSPDGHGFDMHFDARIATTLQIEGSKEWTFSNETALDWPHSQVTLGALQQGKKFDGVSPLRLPMDCTFQSVILHPGDVLCLPAGCWHAAAACGYSLALNLAFDPNSGFFSTFSPALKHMLLLSPGWRAPLPPIYGHQGADAPALIHDFYQTRIDELIEILNLFKSSPDLLNQAWGRLMGTAGVPLPINS